ncbi:hypothetical protein [Bradyrhizobium sp. CCBAU 51753]|uniref:hypothetical protein n=1 Tax=Bradyrhizobium sp. CCBAU 51753 TaxID=1325100 RepID=UPI00188DA13D|nr:hypothetical protein [Bradyrhizobium sp. CCBAU 51753]
MADAIFESFGYITLTGMVALALANIVLGVLAITHHEKMVKTFLKHSSFYVSFLRFGGGAREGAGHRYRG